MSACNDEATVTLDNGSSYLNTTDGSSQSLTTLRAGKIFILNFTDVAKTYYRYNIYNLLRY